jgi:DNA-binding CsgD family transcriptional regulator
VIVPPVASRSFIGRRDELDALKERRRASSGGHGSVVLLGGEAGIGKSRLLGEFVRSLAGGRGPLVVSGECLEHAPRPLGPLRSIVSALVAASPWLAQSAPPFVMRAVAQVVPHALPASDAFANAPRLGKGDLFDALVLLVGLVANKRSLVVTIEDIHWADPATLDFLRHLAPRVANLRLMVVASFRDDAVAPDSPLGAALARLQRENTVHQIALEPLPPDDVRRLLESALEDRERPRDSVLREIERMCEGNPFFAEELLKRSLERDDVELALPISIRVAIATRLGELTSDEQAVLQHAAVLGYRFDPTTLALIAGRDVAAVMPILTRARDLNLIVEESRARITFRFRHALMRQTLYESMLTLAARPLHERIARTLESLPDAGDRLDELAYHWWEARDRAKALEYCDRAGDAAFAVNAFSEAVTYYERALEFSRHDEDRRSHLLRKLAFSFNAGGQAERALSALQEAIDIRIALGDLELAARMIVSAAGQLNNTGDMQRAIDLIERFAANYEGRLSQFALDELRSTQAFIVSNMADAARVRSFLELVRKPEDLKATGRMHYWGARTYMQAILERRDALLEDVGSLLADIPSELPVADIASLTHAGRMLMLAGLPERADEALVRSLEISKRLGFTGMYGCAQATRGANSFLAGRLEEARACLRAALKHDDLAVTRYSLEVWGPLIGTALDDSEFAARCLASGIASQLRERKNDNSLGVALATAALVPAAAGRLDEGRALMAEAADFIEVAFSATPVLPYVARFVDGPRLEKLMRITETADEQRVVVGSAGAHVRAIAAERSGDAAAATKWGLQAARLYREIGWPLLEAQALEVAGQPVEALALYRRAGSLEGVRRVELRARSGAGAGTAARTRPAADGLSDREREVAALVARGLTNRAVAELLFVGEKTVEKHVSSIYHKLGFTTRARLAGYVAAQQSPDDAAAS